MLSLDNCLTEVVDVRNSNLYEQKLFYAELVLRLSQKLKLINSPNGKIYIR